MEQVLSLLERVFFLAIPILIALTVHEAAHAWTAWRLGDGTARWLGRVTLNPLKHLDFAGTITFFFTAYLGAGFGWAKPVPVDYRRIPNARRGIMLVSAAGPLANVSAAIIMALMFHALKILAPFLSPLLGESIYVPLIVILLLGVEINLILAFFNLLPLPPLDGSGVVSGFLSAQAAYRYRRLAPYGFLLLIALLMLPRYFEQFPNFIDALVVRPAEFLMTLLGIPLLS